MMRTLASLSFASLSLVACASQRGEQTELPDTITDGAADSWGYPTQYGTLFEKTWQYGTLDPSASQRNIAYTFALDGNASVKITTREAPADEHTLDLFNSVVYLYKQTDAGTFKRIAKTEANDDWGVLTKSLGEGVYRVLVKGQEDADAGEFMIRLDCDGEGCADGPQCLFGDAYWSLRENKRGAIAYGARTVLTLESFQQQLNNASMKDQIIAAVNEASYEVSTIEEAFDAVDQNEINKDSFYDNLGGRTFRAFEYGAGDNSYGAIFAGNDPTPVAVIGDGDLYDCKVFAQSCVFGRQKGEAAYMPDMTVTDELEFTKPADVPADLAAQVAEAVSYDGATPTLAEAFDSVDENTIYVTKLRHADGREFVQVDYYAGDTAVGAFYAKGSTERLGVISDGEVDSCNAF